MLGVLLHTRNWPTEFLSAWGFNVTADDSVVNDTVLDTTQSKLVFIFNSYIAFLYVIVFIRFALIAIAVAVPLSTYSISFPSRIRGICIVG